MDNTLPKMPVALSHSDICRHDLLFEIELDLKQAYSVYFSTGVATDFFGTAITRQPRAA
jgi:hypothetical protein